MLRQHLARLVTSAVDSLIQSGKLPGAVREAQVEIIDTKQPEHGDYACNFAMVATKKAGMPPRQIGELLQAELQSDGAFEAIELAGPGFINLRLKPEFIAAYVPRILSLREDIAKPQESSVKPQRLNVEFVSVNPNGPITVGSGRGAAFGDTLCRVLEAAGHTINREYYINDGVNSTQMMEFAKSLWRHFLFFSELEDSLEGAQYKGEYMKRLQARLPVASPEVVHRIQEFHKESPDASPLEILEIGITECFKQWHHLSDKDELSEEELRMTENLSMLVNSAFEHEIQGQIEAQELGFNSFQEAARLFAKRRLPTETREPESLLRAFAEEEVKEDQKESLRLFGVEFDTWFSEQSLHESGRVEALLQELQAKGVADEEPYRLKLVLTKKGIESIEREEQASEEEDEIGDVASGSSEGAGNTLWLRSTKFGDDMDRVLRRKDGRLTYISSDVAYHADKFNRPANADKLITILGPDHHGYIARLHAVVAAFLEDPHSAMASGEPFDEVDAQIFRSAEERDAAKRALDLSKEKLEVVIFQIVRFLKDGKPAPMRKRDGNIYELRDLIVELGQAAAPMESEDEQMRIGRDVARFFYLMRSHDTHMDFDIDLATKQSDENPVFYAQYAHARICSVLRKAPPPSSEGEGPERRLVHPREGALIKKLLDLPFEVERSARDYGVHRLTTYAVELARTFHHFYDACRVILPDDPELTQARVALCEATRITLKATFDLLGVSAPEKMERHAAAEGSGIPT
ncbi:MAG: arginine--tRNA ligase [Fimbriimonas sp.]